MMSAQSCRHSINFDCDEDKNNQNKDIQAECIFYVFLVNSEVNVEDKFHAKGI